MHLQHACRCAHIKLMQCMHVLSLRSLCMLHIAALDS